MSEYLPKSLAERVPVDIDPFIESDEVRDDVIYELSEFTRRANVELGKRGVFLALTVEGGPVDAVAEQRAVQRVSDEDLINQAILEAEREGTVISDAAARMIAAQLHSGGGSELYAFASSGVIVSGLREELKSIAKDATFDPMARSWTVPLRRYVKERRKAGEMDHIEGWGSLWLGEAPVGAEAAEYEREQRERIEQLEAGILQRERDNEWDRNVIGNLKSNIEAVQQGRKPLLEPMSIEEQRAFVLAIQRFLVFAHPEEYVTIRPSLTKLDEAIRIAEGRESVQKRADEMVREQYGGGEA